MKLPWNQNIQKETLSVKIQQPASTAEKHGQTEKAHKKAKRNGTKMFRT